MGWLPSIFGSGSDKPSSDPLGKLDPQLRAFLEKESPVKYTTQGQQPQTSSSTSSSSSQPPPPSQASPEPSPPSPQSRQNVSAVATATATAGDAGFEEQKPVLPKASLYQDGRYADLWKTYRPLADVEADTASDHDKLQNVLDAFKERKAVLGKAALENCALQQEEWYNCLKSGSWEDRLQMCRHQVRKFERCYTMQSRFLRALGYASVAGRPVDVDDDIQMHADSLYQRMLQHEAAVAQAKKEGTPIPALDLGLTKPATTASNATPSEETQRKWHEKLKDLPEDERIAEEAALRADLQSKTDVARGVKQIFAERKAEREERRRKGESTWGDFVAGFFGGGK